MFGNQERIALGDTVRLRFRRPTAIPGTLMPVSSLDDTGKCIITSRDKGVVVKVWDKTCDYINVHTGAKTSYPRLTVQYGEMKVTLYEPSFEKMNN